MVVSTITDLASNIGYLVQTTFSKNIFQQTTLDTREFENITSVKLDTPMARETKYLVEETLGYGAVQAASIGGGLQTFPRPDLTQRRELTIGLKRTDTTLQIQGEIYRRALSAGTAKYVMPLPQEAINKAIASKRLWIADFYADGTGVKGTQGSTTVAVTTGTASVPMILTFSLASTNTARGHAGLFEEGDCYFLVTNDGATRRFEQTSDFVGGATLAPTASVTSSVHPLGGTSGTVYVWRCMAKDYTNQKVGMALYQYNLATQVFTPVYASAGTVSTTQSSTATTDVWYRWGQPTFPDLTGTIDYGTVSEVTPGLESIAAYDGRTLDSVVRSGIYGASDYDNSAAAIDSNAFDLALNKVKRRMGAGRFKYTKASMMYETHSALVASREADRRFVSVDDKTRGIKYFAYQHGDDTVEAFKSEYVGTKRIWLLPDKGSEKRRPIQFHGAEPEWITTPDGKGIWHLRPSSAGGHTDDFSAYAVGYNRFVNFVPGAVGCIHNFTNT